MCCLKLGPLINCSSLADALTSVPTGGMRLGRTMFVSCVCANNWAPRRCPSYCGRTKVRPYIYMPITNVPFETGPLIGCSPIADAPRYVLHLGCNKKANPIC